MASAQVNMPYSFDEARTMLSRAGKTRVKIGHNTYVEAPGDGSIHVRYHATSIIVFDGPDLWRTYNGGFDTTTTKARLDQFLHMHGCAMTQKAFVWYVASGSHSNRVPWRPGFNQDDARILRETRERIAAHDYRRL